MGLCRSRQWIHFFKGNRTSPSSRYGGDSADDVEFRATNAEDGPWISGRGSHVFIRDEKIGEFGEIDPKVSGFFGIKSPIQAGEIDLEAIYRIIPDPIS